MMRPDSAAYAAVQLRPVAAADLEIFYEHQLDPVAARMAAFAPRDRASHMDHWQHILADDANQARTVLLAGVVVGNVGCWPTPEGRAVGYWIGRDHWGNGIATRALARFLDEIHERPLIALVAAHNAGSIRVLEKCGFTERARRVAHDGVDERVFELGAARTPAARTDQGSSREPTG